MAEIGRKVGLSRERIRQRVERATLDGKKVISHLEWWRKKKEAREKVINLFKKSCAWDIFPYAAARSYLVRAKMTKLGFLKNCEVCNWKKYPEILVIHHIDKNRKNNHPNNLIVLCPICHNLIHSRNKDYQTTVLGGIKKRGANYLANKVIRDNCYRKAHRYKRKMSCQ